MRTTDWKYDFESLPRWENRKKIPFVFDEYVEIPQADMLCCIYSVAEVGMGKYMGFLALLENKSSPRLVLNVADGYNFWNTVNFSDDGRMIVLKPFIYDRRLRTSKSPWLILDLDKNTFTYFDSSEKVALHNDGIALSDERKINYSELTWYENSRLEALPELVFGA